MINEHEMQFADPDWQPTGSTPAPPGNGVTPAPVSVSLAESINPPSPPLSTSLPPYTQGYQGAWPVPPSPPILAPLPPQARQEAYQAAALRGRPRGRSRGRWLWVVVVVMLFFFFSGSMAFFSHSGHSSAYQAISSSGPVQSSQGYNLNGATELDINDLSGNVTVKAVNGQNTSIQVLSAQGGEPKVFYQGSNMVLTSDDDVTVIVPQNVVLKLSGGMNDLEVDDFTGVLTAQTNSGNITLDNDNLNPTSSLNTNSGDIDLENGSVNGASVTSATGSITLDQVDLSGQVIFSTGGNGSISYTGGTITPSGKYQFITDSGSIALNLPDGTAMQMKVTQKGGHFNSDFPPGSGSASLAEIDITTSSGDITISKM